MKNQVQLITYVDRLGHTLPELDALLTTGPLAGLFGGVHLLPFFDAIDGADAGFDPTDHTRVDPRLGGWPDVKALTGHVDVMADVIVNHMSSDSPQFKDYAARGDASPHTGLFLTYDSVFPNGATQADLLAIYRPRPGLPLTHSVLGDGSATLLWTTFTSRQIDIDVQHPQGRDYLASIVQTLAANGVRMVRLDAVGYAIKKAGTSCFMLPETFAFIDAFSAQARALGVEVLVEIHAYYRLQIEIASRVDRVYDFALPPLVLHALYFHTAQPLKDWIAVRPVNAITVLDTHDGIGIIDIGPDPTDRAGRPGLVPAADIDRLVTMIAQKSGGQSTEATGAAASNLDLYQVNCTFFDALGGDPRAYLLARAIQFFVPGVPQVYYVGLLAGRNDMELLARTRVGRDINRRHYAPDDIADAVAQPVVASLMELIRLRSSHPAFGGTFTLEDTESHVIGMRWDQGEDCARLRIDLRTLEHTVEFTDAGRPGARSLQF